MKIVVDENIACGIEAFEKFGEVELTHGRKISRDTLLDAEALIVRSITNVNKELLQGTPVKFVGTATIGTDHIDIDYLLKNNIAFTDAKGCNADAVAEYVFTALTRVAAKNNISIEGKTLGVVGIGNIGSRVVRLAESIGLKVIKNDPPLQRKDGNSDYVSLEEVLSADFITLHVPLNTLGADKTVHLLNKKNLSQLKQGTVIINASRGQVIDNNALLDVQKKLNLNIVLDVWANEPDINTDLLEVVKIGTPHIAGYSLEGKINGTKIIYNALCRFYNVEAEWTPEMPPVEKHTIEFIVRGDLTDDLSKILGLTYRIKKDDRNLRKILELSPGETGIYFDVLRKNYPLRREFNNYHIKLVNGTSELERILESFRFLVAVNK